MKYTDEIIQKYPKEKRYLLSILTEIINCEPEKYLSKQALEKVATHLNLSTGVVYGVASYYSMLPLKPVRSNTLHVCFSPVCAHAGADELYLALSNDSTFQHENDIEIKPCECLGLCAKAPAATLNKATIGHIDNVNVRSKILSELKKEQL